MSVGEEEGAERGRERGEEGKEREREREGGREEEKLQSMHNCDDYNLILAVTVTVC